MDNIVERARERLKHIKDDGDAVLIDMMAAEIERLRAALRTIVKVYDGRPAEIAKEALGDE